jgi:hypothetical protein
MSSMHPLSNNNLIWSKGIYVQITMCQKIFKNYIKNYISIYIYIYIYIYELNPLWKEPKLGSCNCITEFNVTRTKSEFVFTSTTGFLSGKVTDICWSGGNPQIARVGGARGTHQNSGQLGRTVGQCLNILH